jgi:presenilin-like A22 family membrane protease
MAVWYILWPFGIFYDHLVYFMAILVNIMAIWYILWPFGISYCYLVYIFPFWFVLVRESGNRGADLFSGYIHMY